MQDGAHPKIAKSVRKVLLQHCDDFMMSRYFLFLWFTQYPDPTPMEFLVLRMHQNESLYLNTQTLSDLKDSINR